MQQRAYKNYLLTVLLVIFAFNNVDRIALGILLQDIKVDLSLSDTQLGFLTGIAFALFYSVMGVPIARWADRGNRVTIISLTAAVWSVMVALCGMAASFGQLLLIRIGVAVGEAGCVPPAHSLIADYFSRPERPRAAAVYAMGGPLAFVIGYFLAGWLNELYGWRATFIILGSPGLVLSAVAWFTLREPRLSTVMIESAEVIRTETTVSPSDQQSFRQVCATLWANITFRHLLLGYSVIFFFGYGVMLWQPTFFVRSFGLKTGEVGIWFAAIYGLGGVVGTYLGGALSSRYAANNERLQLRAIAIAKIGHGLLLIPAYLSPNKYVAFGLLAAAALGAFAVYGPLLATIQSLVPERMRAMSIALVYLAANLIGMGLGPLAAGALSDAFRPWVGEESLRYSLVILAPGSFWVAWHLWRASQTVASSLVPVQREPDSRAATPTQVALAEE